MKIEAINVGPGNNSIRINDRDCITIKEGYYPMDAYAMEIMTRLSSHFCTFMPVIISITRCGLCNWKFSYHIRHEDITSIHIPTRPTVVNMRPKIKRLNKYHDPSVKCRYDVPQHNVWVESIDRPLHSYPLRVTTHCSGLDSFTLDLNKYVSDYSLITVSVPKIGVVAVTTDLTIQYSTEPVVDMFTHNSQSYATLTCILTLMFIILIAYGIWIVYR